RAPLTSLLELNEEACGALRRLPVVIPVALDQSYDYLAPEKLDIQPGSFVLVPFGPQLRLGVVWDRVVGPERPVTASKLKPLLEVLDVPPLPTLSLRFAEWIARYTL